jgi:hypothetical protein
MVWAITAGIAWLVGNIPIFRRWLATHPLVQQIAINVLVAGLVSSIVVVIYGRYFASLIEVKASGETKVEGRILTCREGQFIAGSDISRSAWPRAWRTLGTKRYLPKGRRKFRFESNFRFTSVSVGSAPRHYKPWMSLCSSGLRWLGRYMSFEPSLILISAQLVEKLVRVARIRIGLGPLGNIDVKLSTPFTSQSIDARLKKIEAASESFRCSYCDG